jgi:hypothetical protein
MNVANKDLCAELYDVSGWHDTFAWYSGNEVEFEGQAGWEGAVYENTIEYDWCDDVPAYDADYIRDKVKNYDYEIVNLNSETLSLTSDSLEDPDAAILGKTFADLLTNFAIELFKQGILTPKENE